MWSSLLTPLGNVTFLKFIFYLESYLDIRQLVKTLLFIILLFRGEHNVPNLISGVYVLFEDESANMVKMSCTQHRHICIRGLDNISCFCVHDILGILRPAMSLQQPVVIITRLSPALNLPQITCFLSAGSFPCPNVHGVVVNSHRG